MFVPFFDKLNFVQTILTKVNIELHHVFEVFGYYRNTHIELVIYYDVQNSSY